MIGWILRIRRLKKFRQEVMKVPFQDLQKQVDELEVELEKRGFLHQKRDVHLDVEKKEELVEVHACATKKEQEDEDENICELEVDENYLNTTTAKEEYNALVGG